MAASTSASSSASASITPELRQWIIAQAEAGCELPALLQAMRAAGWAEDVAVAALEQTLAEHLRDQGVAVDTLIAEASRPVPEPDLRGEPTWIDAGDRRVAVLTTVALPRLVVFGGFLSDDECEQLKAEAAPRLKRSMTVDTRTGGEELNDDRTSAGMFFTRGESPLIARIEARIARLLNWPVEHGEGIQVLRYCSGAEYKPHYDYFDPAAPGTARLTEHGGQRVGTLVMYLDEPLRGGATTFPDAGIAVAPRRGNAVFFSYPMPHPATRTLHGGAPVLEGEKWIATKWLRERPY
ncbi:2OG-Fe(II) oxygenase [Tibeticola sp.]|jgi:prolyl 4-hydroxylase|uniref:2OG-Fe(II) oxygenase n=1 Tax=Tibeticola sp. TaxID=2005368 RepID=UPI00258A4271|nr:2OG-Fe(II) oxygenase [Tibeticola sp.]MCI4439582.1 2OG-Fe(II) oxygenase [Tibeticola sp.]